VKFIPKNRIVRFALSAALLVAAGVMGKRAWDRYRPLPEPTAGDAARGELAFTDSDLGSKNYGSIPRAVFDALPEIFPDLFIEGWPGLGFIAREGAPDGPPIGMVRVQVLGVETYASNCAICHMGRVGQKLVAGAPNANLNVQQITFSIMTALRRNELTIEAIDRVATKKNKPLSFLEKKGIEAWLAIARQKLGKRSLDWFKNELGPGRSDALNGWKRVLGVPEGDHKSWVDIPNIYNQKLKTHMLLDGSVTGDPAARVTMTELEKGRPPRDTLLHREVFDDLVAYLNQRIAPPAYPFPIDAKRAEQGHALFDDTCSGCHGSYGPGPRTYPNKRIASERVGTDPERALAMTMAMNEPLKSSGYSDILKIDPQQVYIAPPLDGVWATAPYLHNGSVPTLWHLLEAPAKRPAVFSRGWNEFDPVHVGLACAETSTPLECAPDAEQKKHDPRVIFRYDARKPGNLNTGHTFGEKLSDDERSALVEYLKTI
jgi:mono/diheme cytochrome c family protein